jgi:uncharacterized membrane protein YraQ (UPF0718 family)
MPDLYFRMLDLFRHTYTDRIVSNFFGLAALVAPYFVVSVFFNALLQRYFADKRLFAFSRNETFAIFLAAFIGLLSPLPTYIAVPLGISLLATGLPFSAVAAFMVSSPLMNPGIFYLTWIELGAEIALARVVAAFGLSLTAGYLARFFMKKNWLPSFVAPKAKESRPLWIEFGKSLIFLGKYFVIALFLGAAVKALVPAEMISRILGAKASMSLIVAVALGVPFYSCGGAAIPLVQVLSEMGMNKGAVLAFFIAGPSTKLETMYVYKSVLGFKIFILYFVFMIAGAFLCGFLLLRL